MSGSGPFGSAAAIDVLSRRLVASDWKTTFSPAPVMNALKLGPLPWALTLHGSPFFGGTHEELTISMKSLVGADLPPPARFGSVRRKTSVAPFVSSSTPT